MAVFRFAPSPNGLLHLGHAYSALLNAGLAARDGGQVLLRLEDIDRQRCRPDYEIAIHEDLAWLGLGFAGPVWRQSEHHDAHAAAIATLRAKGLVYPAFLSRAETAAIVAEWSRSGAPWPRDPDGAPLFPPLDRDRAAQDVAARIAAGAPHAWRLNMERALSGVGDLDWLETGEADTPQRIAAHPAAWGDIVLAGRETAIAYHLAVVVDDAAQGVTDVVRGRDLFAATSVHRLLQHHLGLPPPRYRHHRLIRDASGRKLAKSARDTGIAALREAGATPDDIRTMIGIDADLAAISDSIVER